MGSNQELPPDVQVPNPTKQSRVDDYARQVVLNFNENFQYTNLKQPDRATRIMDISKAPQLFPTLFFNVVKVVMPPTIYGKDIHANSGCDNEEDTFSISLNDEEVNLLSPNRACLEENNCGNNDYVLQLRLCKIKETYHFFPVTLFVKINGATLMETELNFTFQLDKINKSHLCPINLTTDQLKLDPKETNSLVISWKKCELLDCALGFAVYIGKIVKVDALMESVKNDREPISEMDSLKLVMEMFQKNTDDIVTTTLKACLVCPLGKSLIQTPCRSKSCAHIQCFDGSFFLSLNDRNESWICPVCDSPVKYSDIHVDKLWLKILEQVPVNCHEIEFQSDGSWTYVNNQNKVVLTTDLKKTSIEVITIEDDGKDIFYACNDNSTEVEILKEHLRNVKLDDSDIIVDNIRILKDIHIDESSENIDSTSTVAEI